MGCGYSSRYGTYSPSVDTPSSPYAFIFALLVVFIGAIFTLNTDECKESDRRYRARNKAILELNRIKEQKLQREIEQDIETLKLLEEKFYTECE